MSEDLRAALAALGAPPPAGRAATSDLSVDESLLLHGAGFEPADLVSGVSIQSIPFGSFGAVVGQREPVELAAATEAVTGAFRASAERLRAECAAAGGAGVVGVDVELGIGRLAVQVSLCGTAVRPLGARRPGGVRPFVTDLSVQDYVLLARAGFEPVDLVSGASLVAAPLRSLRQLVAQAGQNVELDNLTRALQDARERAMERLQRSALGAGATGVVDVSILDAPLGHARHVLAFVCYGTALRLAAERPRRLEPELVLPLDDPARAFEARSLRTAR
ncbi:MAG TPA: heavy metal-binding domain-containing protein [Acidimicrobiales bacterium]|nr:heavy metal-binding domain-containing protein [Acidimicrobiales bacterium]